MFQCGDNAFIPVGFADQFDMPGHYCRVGGVASLELADHRIIRIDVEICHGRKIHSKVHGFQCPGSFSCGGTGAVGIIEQPKILCRHADRKSSGRFEAAHFSTLLVDGNKKRDAGELLQLLCELRKLFRTADVS